MDARCTTCSGHRAMRNQRGMKLSYLVCSCGGHYERMNSNGKLYGTSPDESLAPTQVPYITWPDQRTFYYTHVNTKGVHYLLDYSKNIYIPVVK